MSQDSTTDFSQLSSLQEQYIVVDMYVIGSMGMVAAIYYLFSVYDQLNQENNHKYYQSAIKCAMISFFCSIIVFFIKLFFLNDLIISWSGFTSNESSFVSVTDSVHNFFFFVEKLFLYYGFTFHTQSLLNKEKMSGFLKFWMIGAGVAIIVTCIIYIVDDSVHYTPKEIGITEHHYFHIAMFLGHQGANWTKYCAMFLIVIDIIYFFCILYIYITGLKQMQRGSSINVNVGDALDKRAQDVKGVVLVIFVSILFCFVAAMVAADLSIKYSLESIVVVSDNLCLFLMFKGNERLYNSLCGRLCGSCCVKIVYNDDPRYSEIAQTDESEQDVAI